MRKQKSLKHVKKMFLAVAIGIMVTLPCFSIMFPSTLEFIGASGNEFPVNDSTDLDDSAPIQTSFSTNNIGSTSGVSNPYIDDLVIVIGGLTIDFDDGGAQYELDTGTVSVGTTFSVTVYLGRWKPTSTTSWRNIRGFWVVVDDNPGIEYANSGDFPPQASEQFSSSIADAGGTITVPMGTVFDNHFATKPSELDYGKYYVHVYALFFQSLTNFIENPARRVSVRQIIFKNNKALPNVINLDLAGSGANAYYQSPTVDLGGIHHSFSLQGLDTSSNTKISAGSGGTLTLTDVPADLMETNGIVYLDDANDDFGDLGGTRINSVSLGYSQIRMKWDGSITVPTVTHSPLFVSPVPIFAGHEFSFSVVEPGGTNARIPAGSLLLLGNDGGTFDNEGFGLSTTEGLETVNIESAYDIDVIFTPQFGSSIPFDGEIDFEVGTSNQLDFYANFLSSKSAPFTISIRFSRKRTDFFSIGLGSDLNPDVSDDGSKITLQWNSLPFFTGVDGTSEYRYDIQHDITSVEGANYVLPDGTVTTTNVGTLFQKDYMNVPTIEATFEIITSVTFYEFTLNLRVREVFSSGAVDLVPPVSLVFTLFYDRTMVVPSGSIGNVFFDSPDVVSSGGTVRDKDGDYFLRADVSSVSNVDGYEINAYKVPVGVSSIDPLALPIPSPVSTFKVNFTGTVLSVRSTDIFATQISKGTYSPGIYQYTITPYAWSFGMKNPSRAFSLTKGDVSTENAIGSDSWIKITYIAFKNAEIDFTPNGLEPIVPGNEIDSETGVFKIKPSNYFTIDNDFLVDGSEVILEQLVGGVKQHTIFGFDDDFGNAAFKLYADTALTNVREYPSGLPLRFETLTRNGIEIGTPRGTIDGTYVYRARYNYDIYGLSSSVSDKTVNVLSARSLLVNDDASFTSYSGSFTLSWNEFWRDPPSPFFESSEVVDRDSIFYIVLFGKASEGVTPSLFKGDLSMIPGNIDILEKNVTEDGAIFETWEKYLFDRTETDVVIDEKWGSDFTAVFDDTLFDTFYFAVVPFYRVHLNEENNNIFDFTWYHGDVSNVVQVDIDKQVFNTLNIDPSIRVGPNRVVYTQNIITFEAFGLTTSSFANTANVTIETFSDATKSSVESSYFANMVATGSGRFEITLDIFSDLGVDKATNYISALIQYDFTTAGIGDGIPLGDRNIIIETGVVSSITFISPGEGGILKPSTTSTGELIFSINVFTDPSLASQFSLPQFPVDPEDVSITSGSIVGEGNLFTFGTVAPISGTFNWRITLNNLFRINDGLVTINLEVTVASLVTLKLSPSFTFNLAHDPSIAVINPVVVTGDSVVIPGFDPIVLRWVGFFGTDIKPDSMVLDVRKNGNPFFTGVITPVFLFYQYTLNPLQHDTGDVFDIFIASAKGSTALGSFSFTLELDFDVIINVDLGDFQYNSNDPTIGGEVDAFVEVEYPVSYDLFFLETGQVIFDRLDYKIVRDLGGGNTIEFIPFDAGRPTQLAFDMTGRPAVAGQVDNLVFEIGAPFLTKQGFSFPEENKGTLFEENITITSPYLFTNLDVTVSPSATFIARPDEVWIVLVQGQNVTFTLTPGRDLNFQVDSINPGQVILITIIHYNEDEVIFPEPPQPPPRNIFQIIWDFIVGIIMAILAFFGLAVIIKKRRSSNAITKI